MRNLNEEQQEQVRNMDVESLAKFTFRYLKNNLNPNPKSEGFYLCSDALRGTLFTNGQYQQQLANNVKLLEAIILLERRGLVARDIPYEWLHGSRKKFMLYLTSIGWKSNLHDGFLLLVDKPEETVGKLEEKVVVLDPVVRQYYLESIRAYQEGLYISSVICLGAASERAIHWLGESTICWLMESKEPNSERHRKGIEGRIRKIPDLVKYLSHSVIPQVPEIDETLVGKLKKQLKELGDLYRENRNNAGHPKTVEQTSWLGDDQEILLIHFRRYITTICEAIKRLKNNGNV